jgi:hypothetical protein
MEAVDVFWALLKLQRRIISFAAYIGIVSVGISKRQELRSLVDCWTNESQTDQQVARFPNF